MDKRIKRILLSLTLIIALGFTMLPQTFAAAGEMAEDDPVAGKEQPAAEDLLEGRDYAKDQLLVTYRDGTSDRMIKKEVQRQDASVEEITRVTDDQKTALVDTSQGDAPMEETIEELLKSEEIESVQPNYRYTISSDLFRTRVNDEKAGSRPYQTAYQLEMMKAEKAWSLITAAGGGTTVKVAVLDTGCDRDHEDLGNIRETTSVTGVDPDIDADPAAGHGTHISGIIGATANNKVGIAGVASGSNNELVRLCSIGCADQEGSLYTQDCIKAINIAKKKNARVVNMSWGGYGRDKALAEAIRDGYENNDMVFIGAAGNSTSTEYSEPSDLPEVISVLGGKKNGSTLIPDTDYSDYNYHKDILAPGTGIFSTMTGGRYGSMSGSSMAAASASGAAALVIAANPQLRPWQVMNILYATADNVKIKGEDPSGFDVYSGYGAIDAEAAVDAALTIRNNGGTEADAICLKSAFATGGSNATKKEIVLLAGDELTLETMIKPATYIKGVSWKSDDQTTAAVDRFGNVTARRAGTALITGTVNKGTAKEHSVSVRIRVKSSKSTKPVITNKNVIKNLLKGDSVEPLVKFQGESSNERVVLKSSNDKVIKVENNVLDESSGSYFHMIYAVGIGTATVTVENWNDKNKSDSVTITVHPSVNGVKFNSKQARIRVGKTASFSASVTPAGAWPVGIRWKSSAPRILSVNAKTGKVKGLKAGTARITATASNGAKVTTTVKVLKAKTIKVSAGPGRTTLKLIRSGKRAVVKVKKVRGATGYEIFVKKTKSGKWKKVKTLKGTVKTTWKTKRLKKGKKYRYKARAYRHRGGVKKYGPFSKVRAIRGR